MASRRGSYKDQDKCGQCNKAVTDRDRGVLCDMCESWYHTSCEGISEEVYKVLDKTDALHWFCNRCNSGVVKILKSVGKLTDKIAEVEARMLAIQGETQSEMQKLRQSINEIDNTVRNVVEAKLTGEVKKNVEQHVVQFRDIVKEQLEEEIGKKELLSQVTEVSGELDEVRKSIQITKEQADEQRDKESRRNNIILYNVPESDSPRVGDRNKADISFSLQMFNNCMNVGLTEEDFINVFRLGKRGESPRPLMIQLAGYNHKNLIMESLYKLRHAESKFKRIVVAHDMTKTEREECKRLVSEAKSMTEDEDSGEYTYRVRGLPGKMKIVKIRVRS